MRAELAENALRISALVAMTEELARHDPLTGVLNRRVMNELLAAELQRSYRTGHPFCFAIIDLDHFRDINEGFGHDAGDLVLRTVSEASLTLLRALDRFARLGGAEFGILFPATWLHQGVTALGRLREAIGACAWDSITPGRALTFSVGLTTNAPGDNAETLMARAEKALKSAKEEGGNRLVQIEKPLPPMVDDEDVAFVLG